MRPETARIVTNRCGLLVRTVLLLLLCLAVAGCARAINRAAERRIREALPGLLGSAQQYRVHVQGDPTRTIHGKMAYVSVDADNLQLADGLLLDRLHLDLRGVDYDTAHRQLRHIDSAGFRATVGQGSLDEFFAGEAPPGETLRDVHITLREGDQVTISGERVTLGVGVPFRLSGPLRVVGTERMEIDPTRLEVVGIPLTGMVLRFLKGHFEHAIDLSGLPFAIRLSSVETARGSLTLSGTADLSRLPAGAAH